MRLPSIAALAASLLLAAPAAAAPEAHLLRVDARGAPLLTTVVDLTQTKRIADVTAPCAALSGDAQLDCLGDTLERPGALYSAFAFPEKNALFTVTVGRSDTPLTFESAARWSDSAAEPRAGTAWLVMIDLAPGMGPRLADAKEIAAAFADAMKPNDVIDVVALGDTGAAFESSWLSAKDVALASIQRLPGAPLGAGRPSAAAIRVAASNAYRDLFTSNRVEAPLHQAMVLLSDGERGDADAAAIAAADVRTHLSQGRFPPGGTTPKMPVAVASIWLPTTASSGARALMEGLANPEIGGFFTAVRSGRRGRAPGIVAAVRGRFDKLHLVKWRLTCTVFGPTQSFKLSFANTTPSIAGDATFQDVPYNGPGLQPCKK